MDLLLLCAKGQYVLSTYGIFQDFEFVETFLLCTAVHTCSLKGTVIINVYNKASEQKWKAWLPKNLASIKTFIYTEKISGHVFCTIGKTRLFYVMWLHCIRYQFEKETALKMAFFVKGQKEDCSFYTGGGNWKCKDNRFKGINHLSQNL